MTTQSPSTPTVTWTGKSGKKYLYFVYEIGHKMADVPGNYIWAKLENGRYLPRYIGEAEQLGQRATSGHEKYPCVLRNGATHVMAHRTEGIRQVRLDEETDLRNNYPTTCNDQ